MSRAIGKRVRKLVREADSQLEAHRHEGLPMVIVAVDCTSHAGAATHLSKMDIGSVFGNPMVRFYKATEGQEPPPAELVHGRDAVMRPDENTFISAICVMLREGDLDIWTFHNRWAGNPLFPRYLPDPRDRHFVMVGELGEALSHYHEYVGPRA